MTSDGAVSWTLRVLSAGHWEEHGPFTRLSEARAVYRGCVGCTTELVGALGEARVTVRLDHAEVFGAVGDVVDDTRYVLEAWARHGVPRLRDPAVLFLGYLG